MDISGHRGEIHVPISIKLKKSLLNGDTGDVVEVQYENSVTIDGVTLDGAQRTLSSHASLLEESYDRTFPKDDISTVVQNTLPVIREANHQKEGINEVETSLFNVVNRSLEKAKRRITLLSTVMTGSGIVAAWQYTEGNPVTGTLAVSALAASILGINGELKSSIDMEDANNIRAHVRDIEKISRRQTLFGLLSDASKNDKITKE